VIEFHIVANLEHEVGAALLIRATRTLALTEAGADYLQRIEPILLFKRLRL
jgi:DNA-binding transcriptional LysR family regulator